MRGIASAIVTAALAVVCGAGEPGGRDEVRDLRERIETLDREFGREMPPGDEIGEPGRGEGERMRPPMPPGGAAGRGEGGPGRGPERMEGPGGRGPGKMDGPAGRGPGGPERGMAPAGRPGTAAGRQDGPMPGRGAMTGHGGPVDLEFELKMQEREILHKIENLKFELETIRLRREHLRRQAAGPGKDGHGRPGQDGPRPGADRPGPDGPRKDGMQRPGAEDDRKHELKRAAEELRQLLHRAEESGDRESARAVREKLEHVMRELTGEHREEVERKGAHAMERIERRMGDIKKEMMRAKEAGERERYRELEQEAQKLRAMAEEIRRAGKPEGKPAGEPRKEKKPRMI